MKIEHFYRKQVAAANLVNMADSSRTNDDLRAVNDLTSRVGEVSMDDDPDVVNGSDPMSHDVDDSELPNTVIVTNVADSVFTDPNTKTLFEATFREYDESATVLFLRNFRRARVEYSSHAPAAMARVGLHETDVCGQRVKCYFAQPRESSQDSAGPHLQPPVPDKQFLISPPASPPVGWEPVPESEPIINFDLLSAISNLAPGEAHEIHPPSEEHPGIVVHVCEDPEGFATRPRITQTRRPTPT